MGLRIGVIQTEPVFGRPETNVNQALLQIRGQKADLWLLPELFTSGYLFEDAQELKDCAEVIPGGYACKVFSEYAKATGASFAFGIPERDGEVYYNSMVLATPDGRHQTYRKLHLFDREKIWFQPGNLPLEVRLVGKVRVGMMICFDWIFPEVARTLALRGADVILHAANLVLPWGQAAMVTRAVENRVHTVTANRVGTETRAGVSLTFTGRSQICECTGRVLAQASADQPDVLIAELDTGSARQKALNDRNDLFRDRRPEYYDLS